MYQFCVEAGYGAEAQRNRLWVRFPIEEIKYLLFALLSRRSTAFSFTTRNTMPPEFGGN